MSEGKVTLTCGHTNATPVGIWEPEIDRHGDRCRSYSTYCPVCAEDASLAMVKRIEDLEAENKRLREALHSVAFRSVDDDIHWCQRIAREALAQSTKEGEE